MQTIRTRFFILPLFVLVLGAALLAACSDDDTYGDPQDDPPPTSAPTPTASPEPQDPAPSPAPGVIGVPAFDDLANDFMDGDIDTVVDAIDYNELECATVQGLGGPPECRPGEAEGAVVSVISFDSCEGEYLREDQVRGLLQAQASRTEGVYAAFALKNQGTPERPLGEFGILFELDGGAGVGSLALMFGVSDDGHLVGLWAGCGATPADLFAQFSGAEVLLAPQA